jgi:anti-sigma factor RsiW
MLDQELHALIDGELEHGPAQMLANRLAADPDLAERVALFRRDRDQLRRIYGPVLQRPVPASVLPPVPVRALRPRVRWLPATAAMAAAIALAIFGGVASMDTFRSHLDPLVAQAIAVRDGVQKAELQVAPGAVSPDALDDILARNFSGSPRVPDLAKAGYRLMAMFLYRDDAEHNAVELRYRDAQNRLFTVYLTRPREPQGFELVERGKLRLCIWKNEDLSAVMVGEMSTDEMLRVASLTYGDLNF